MRKVQLWFSAVSVAAALAFVAPLAAQQKPANATAECKDGTYSTAKTKRGACSGHGGVATWYADAATKADAKAAGKSTKDAAKSTKDAAKDAGKATKNVAKATSGAAESAANSIKPRPSDAPQDATAKCKDGTYSHAKQHRGACSGHGGVAEWYK